MKNIIKQAMDMTMMSTQRTPPQYVKSVLVVTAYKARPTTMAAVKPAASKTITGDLTVMQTMPTVQLMHKVKMARIT